MEVVDLTVDDTDRNSSDSEVDELPPVPICMTSQCDGYVYSNHCIQNDCAKANTRW